MAMTAERSCERLADALVPGVVFENGYMQTQSLTLGPVGNLFFSVRFKEGMFVSAVGCVKKLSPDHRPRLFNSRERRFDTFEDALSHTVAQFIGFLEREREIIDYAVSYDEYCAAVLEASRERLKRDRENLKGEIHQLEAEVRHLLGYKYSLLNWLRGKAGVKGFTAEEIKCMEAEKE